MPKRATAPRGKSQVFKRSVNIGAHKTSIALEDAFWDAIKDIATAQGSSVDRLIATINSERHERQHTNLSSAIRQFVLAYYRSRMRP